MIMKIIKKALEYIVRIARNGVPRLFYLFFISYILPIGIKILSLFSFYYDISIKIIKRFLNYSFMNYNREINYWRNNKNEILRNSNNGYRVKIDYLNIKCYIHCLTNRKIVI